MAGDDDAHVAKALAACWNSSPALSTTAREEDSRLNADGIFDRIAITAPIHSSLACQVKPNSG